MMFFKWLKCYPQHVILVKEAKFLHKKECLLVLHANICYYYRHIKKKRVNKKK